MSKIAVAISPGAPLEKENMTIDLTEEEPSVEQLLEEARKLYLENSNSLSKSSSKSNAFLPEDPDEFARLNNLEKDIFQQIEAEMHKESEKRRKNPKNESVEIVQKGQDSSDTDSDGAIELQPKSEEIDKPEKNETKESLQKEITDVDKDFFQGLLKRSTERMEGGLSNSSSFEQEDFSHFLKLLQVQSGSEPFASPFFEQDSKNKTFLKSPGYPEQEIAAILEKEQVDNVFPFETLPRKKKVPKASPRKSKSVENDFIRPVTEEKKIEASNDELYEVVLTPRLELFADAIPKLIAERSQKEKALAKAPEETPKKPVERTLSAPEKVEKVDTKARNLAKAKSLDQLVPSKKSKKGEVKLKPALLPRTKFSSKPKVTPVPRVANLTKNLTKNDYEALYNEEKRKNHLLKQQIEAESKQYKSQIESMRTCFESELFSLKKQNIVLKAKMDEKSFLAKRGSSEDKETATKMLEGELERQEKLLKTYEVENKKLAQEVSKLKTRGPTAESIQRQKLATQVKELQAKMQKLSKENGELRHENAETLKKSDDFSQQNSLLKDELEMFKEQLSIKNNFITTRLQAMTTAEMSLKKQLEDLKVELSSKTEQLKSIKLDYDKLQFGTMPVEKEMMELKAKESGLQEKLQLAKSHVEREKKLSQKLKDQVRANFRTALYTEN